MNHAVDLPMKMPEQESMARSDISATALAPASAEPRVGAAAPTRTRSGWLVLVCACYLAAAFAVTWHLWAHPSSATVAGNPEDSAQFAWFMRYAATAVAHGRLPSLLTTAMNVPRGVNMMWNTSVLLPGMLLTPVTLLAGPQVSLTVLLTLGFAGSAASLFYVLRRHGVSVPAAAIGGAVYGFSPALTHSAMGHYQLQFAVLPPLIVDAILRICLGSPRPVRSGVWLGLLAAAQLFIGEEMLFESALAAVILLVVLALSWLLRWASPVRLLKLLAPSRLRRLPGLAWLGVRRALAWLRRLPGLAWLGVRRALAWLRRLPALAWLGVRRAPSRLRRVLGLARPRRILAAVRSVVRLVRRWPVVVGLTTAVVVAGGLSSWGLWTQFAGPLTQHGSPFAADGYKNSLASFISPTSFQLLHAGSASSGGTEALAYLGVTLIVVLLVAAVVFWRQLPVRACAVTAVLFLLLSVGAHPIVDHGTFNGVTLPWSWLENVPVVGDLLPNRLAILGDGAAAALLAFAIDLTWKRLSRTAIGKGWATGVVAAAAVIAVLPLVPRPLPAQPAVPLPAGWSATLSALRLQPGARVLVVPVPSPVLDDALRWQADTGTRISLIGGYFEGPDKSGEAHIGKGIVEPLTVYMDNVWTGTGNRTPVPPAAIASTLRYWDPQAVVADAPPYKLLRLLESLFGPPSIRDGSMLGWRLAGAS
jgi:hypothetical protein